MYLVRKVSGQYWRTYEIRGFTDIARVWKFTPHLGGAFSRYPKEKAPSRLCYWGIAAIAETEAKARYMVNNYKQDFIQESKK